MMVPYSQRWRLLATFNGGFTYEDGDNGSNVNGHVNEPLKDGKATLLGYRDGRGRDREVERRPERRAGNRMGAPEPRSDRLERTASTPS